MGKNIALFFDGTWYSTDNNTNVWRLFSLCARADRDGTRQATYYTKGVGTSFGDRIRGGMFGYGLDGLIKGGYDWLVANYDPGDRLFVFGFSRGAYAARSLAGLVARCGILKPGSPIGVGELFARSLLGDGQRTLYALLRDAEAERLGAMTVLDHWMLDYGQKADVTMVGVWDTVGALRGMPGYRETGLRRPILNAFHALSIDEHRPSFAPTLWTTTRRPGAEPAPPRALAAVEQRWFAGTHTNVGGGYNSDLLPQLPLRWIMGKAAALGLAFRDTVEVDDKVYGSAIADSFRAMAGGAYYALNLGRAHLRPIGPAPARGEAGTVATVNETVDASVFERWRRDPAYRPTNLADWARRHGADPTALAASVLAADPRVRVDGTVPGDLALGAPAGV